MNKQSTRDASPSTAPAQRSVREGALPDGVPPSTAPAQSSTGPAQSSTAPAQSSTRPAQSSTAPTKNTKNTKPPKTSWAKTLRKDWQLYSLLLLPLLYLLIFRYLPMAGNLIAFRQFHPGGNIFGDKWDGLKYFNMFIHDPNFWNVFWNTVRIGAATLLFVFPLPIILALLLNELRSQKFKKFVQTTTYLPHFLSIVIVSGVVLQITSLNGAVNQVLKALTGNTINFMQEASWFTTIYVSSEVWQTVGWGTILYLAALTTIDTSLYEAAKIDGANRLQQTWHITLPGIAPTIVTLLVLNIGSFMAVGFEKILLLYNPLLYPTADVISTYLYRVGLQSGSFSYAAAIGLFEALIGLTLVFSANLLSRKLIGASLW